MNTPFTITEVAQDLLQITEHFYTEAAHMYLLRGSDFDLLIDAGLGLYDIREFLEQQGYTPKVFITHAHYDHIGGLRHFAQQDILLHPRVKANIADMDLWALEYMKEADFLIQVSLNTLKAQMGAIAEMAQQIPAYESQYLSNGSHRLEILHLPGHTDDSVCLYDHRSESLWSGDVLYRGELYCSCVNSCPEDYRTSLQTLQKLPIRCTFPGHNEVLDASATQDAIAEWLDILVSPPGLVA